MRSAPAVVGVALWLALVAGCQFFVDGDLGVVHCTEEGAIGPPACPDNLSCVDGLCELVTGANRELGASCEADQDCAAGLFCMRPVQFDGDGGAICSTSCCTSSDCGETEDGFICWAPPGGGGSFCRRAASVGRVGGGAGKVGEACFVNDYCRSGLCKEGSCADTCCTDASCTGGGGAVCRVRPAIVSDGANWACGVPPIEAFGEFLDPCLAHGDCRSGLCVEIGGEQRCTIPCCDSAVCGAVIAAQFPGLLACVDVPHKGSLVRACARWLPEAASGAVGAACTTDLECRGGKCIEGTGGEMICSDVCCTDASCGDSETFVCRPHEVGANFALRCEMK